jgi:hypothetical protein
VQAGAGQLVAQQARVGAGRAGLQARVGAGLQVGQHSRSTMGCRLQAARWAAQCVAEKAAQRWRARAQEGAGMRRVGRLHPRVHPRLPRVQAGKMPALF